VAVIEGHKRSDRPSDFVEIAEDSTIDGLLLEGAVEAFGDAVGLGLLDEGKARGDAPEGDLMLKMV